MNDSQSIVTIHSKNFSKLSVVASLLCLAITSHALPCEKKVDDIKHVLLISVDGLHQKDVDSFSKSNPDSTIAKLLHTGVYFNNASTSKPSDSFPGLMAQVTGGIPATTGVWYDNAWDGSLFPAGSNCKGTPGIPTTWDESLDFNSTAVFTSINDSLLPERLVDGECVKVQPYEFLRVNTIFEVAKKYGLVTAWTDKLPAYSIIRGPSGTGVDDLFVPEISGVNKTNVTAVEGYDELHIKAILNWINSLKADGSPFSVPAIFGGNFQSVSVAQKSTAGGYLDANGTPSAVLKGALEYVDDALGQFVDALDKKGLLDCTIIIISAKHGQSPIDRTKLKEIPKATLSAQVTVPINQLTVDDVALFYLKNHNDSGVAAKQLLANATLLGITTLYEGQSLIDEFHCNPCEDSRCPDIAIKTNVGIIYSTAPKIAEHGGFNEDDLHVPIIVSHPTFECKVDSTFVETRSIAPFILSVLGMDPNELEAVCKDQTPNLPLFE
ncbi:9537_t:CDS:2 [Acaulospora colombiana]|uniref:9537_t:CDS:1 n=1 Tax=Acaulospora colombiana TaxID=27376 RepID=A0ACA9JUX2_9GLOM|nr:9537_t:CDS:2 [Acaulospora colombiana]